MIFRSDDGREIDEDDVRAMLGLLQHESYSRPVYERILAALDPKPKTCGAVMRFNAFDEKTPEWFPTDACCGLLPPDKDGFHEGHHAYERGSPTSAMCGVEVGIKRIQTEAGAYPPYPYSSFCNKPESDPAHWKGHMPAQEVWQ